MEEQITHIKNWLGAGSVNIFGSAFAGKDTIGERLAEVLNAEFLSSGNIIRAARDNTDAKIATASKVSDGGSWMPTDEFRDLVLPYLYDEKLENRALILSMVGRWIGEETPVIEALKRGGHDTRAILLIDISEDEVWRRWEAAGDGRNGEQRPDDMVREKVQRRLNEFRKKTQPVIEIYRSMGLVIEINGEQTRDEVFAEVVSKLHEFLLDKAIKDRNNEE